MSTSRTISRPATPTTSSTRSKSSHDYDPGPGLEKISAPLLAINSADDLINPPELRHPGARDQAGAERAGDHAAAERQDRGHGTHTLAAVWKTHLVALLKQTER